jgi:hypothetical protein
LALFLAIAARLGQQQALRAQWNEGRHLTEDIDHEQKKPAARFSAYAIVFVGAVIMFARFSSCSYSPHMSAPEIFQVPPPMWFGKSFLTNLDLLTARIPLWRNFDSAYTLGSCKRR